MSLLTGVHISYRWVILCLGHSRSCFELILFAVWSGYWSRVFSFFINGWYLPNRVIYPCFVIFVVSSPTLAYQLHTILYVTTFLSQEVQRCFINAKSSFSRFCFMGTDFCTVFLLVIIFSRSTTGPLLTIISTLVTRGTFYSYEVRVHRRPLVCWRWRREWYVFVCFKLG